MKKIPLRKCVVTNKMFEKEHLLRVCKNSNNEVFVDLTNKAPGRGAYVLKDKDVILKAQKNKIFEKVFQCEIPEQVYIDLLKEID
ncbi:MAG TPA: DUF448 domain-containing protein [Firmicutes bacterium]|nr:DUF448 domain-containing protein [Bacillota bacterium]